MAKIDKISKVVGRKENIKKTIIGTYLTWRQIKHESVTLILIIGMYFDMSQLTY